jgi:hypothetical protein
VRRRLLAAVFLLSACSTPAPVMRVEIAPTPGVVADGAGLERARKALAKRFEAASPKGANVRVERGSLVVDLNAKGAANWAELRYVIELTGRLDFVPIATNVPFAKELVDAATTQGIVVTVEKGRDLGAENLVFEATGGDRVALASRMRVLLGRVTNGDSRWAVALEVAEPGGVPRVHILDRDGAMEHVKILEATPSADDFGGRVNAALTKEGDAKFAELTGRLVGRKLAILVDGEIQSAPIVMEAIHGGRVQITLGRVDDPIRVSERLAYALGGGELPFPLEIRSEAKVGSR